MLNLPVVTLACAEPKSMLNLPSHPQVLNPERGRLEHRIGKVYLDELFRDSGIDLEETAYWFHTPPGIGVWVRVQCKRFKLRRSQYKA